MPKIAKNMEKCGKTYRIQQKTWKNAGKTQEKAPSKAEKEAQKGTQKGQKQVQSSARNGHARKAPKMSEMPESLKVVLRCDPNLF